MPTVCLQDWTTIRGSSTASVAQSATGWLDAEEFADATFWLEVREVTNPAGGTVSVSYETAPLRDESLFVPMANVASVAVTTTGAPIVTRALLNGGPLVPLARWVRWKLTGTQAGTWDVTFRVFVSFGYGTPGAICPLGIDGCVLWLRADRGVTLNGSRVSGWSDQSGKGNHFSQATAANQPLFVASDVNQQPVISFAASRPDYLSGPTLSSTGGLTMACVVNYQIPATNYAMFVSVLGQDELRTYQTTGKLQYATAGFDNCVSFGIYSNQWLAAIGRHDASNNVELRQNKTVVATAVGGALGTAALAIGARGAGSFPVTGKIAEVAIWNRYLTSAECDSYAAYAVAQWALT